MWLTGFDVPRSHAFIDAHDNNLMQAIARVNRVYKDKTGGLIVDYLGIASDLKKALSFYSDAGGKGDPANTQEQAVQLMLENSVVSQMFHGFPTKPILKPIPVKSSRSSLRPRNTSFHRITARNAISTK